MIVRRSSAGLLLVLTLLACRDRQATQAGMGSHAGLECTECHVARGPGENMVSVGEGRCGSCHAATDMAEQVTVANVSLAHLTHPGVEGEALGCGACHSHSSGEEPLTVTTGNCFLCHTEPPQTREADATAFIPEDDCAMCHVQPTHTAFAVTGAPIDHATVLERGVSCLLCHYDVASGTGHVPGRACSSCHGVVGGPLPERPDTTVDAAGAHGAHYGSGQSIACAQCHEPVDHSVVRLASSLRLECEGCHQRDDAALRLPLDSTVHRSEQVIYSGLDPHHAEVQPSLKFISRVSCESCHSESSMQAPERSERRIAAIQDACVSCHGQRFAPLLRPWLRGAALHTSAVGEYVRTASADPRIRAVAASDSLATEARSRWALVDSGHAVHNPAGADSLLRSALDAAVRSYGHAGIDAPPEPDMGPSAAAVSCVRCHFGIDTDASWIPEGEFDHTEHVLEGDIECSACHGSAELFLPDSSTFDPDHGATLIVDADCAQCHHVERPGECVECHTAMEVANLPLDEEMTVRVAFGEHSRTRSVPFVHDEHSSVDCLTCHEAPTLDRPAIACADCHTEHHTEAAEPLSCQTCHGRGLLDPHERTDHFECAACHTTSTLLLLETADRPFCLQCHVEQWDHRPEGECATCHLLRSPDQTMRIILQAEDRQPTRRERQ